MADSKTFVIIGGGLAGAKAAEALRESGFGGKVVLLADEEHLPYERPPLSKEFLAGKKALSDFTVHKSEWYRENKIEVRTDSEAVSIDPSAHTVKLSDDTSVSYDKLLLATGSRSRWLSIPGADSTGVHYLRKYDDAVNLDTTLKEGSSLAIIGAGWIGLEVAASARQRGVDVTVVETAKVPLSAAVGEEVGKVFAQLHRDHGVDLRLDVEVKEVTTEDGKATGLKLGDGTTITADRVLIAVGAQPNIEIAEQAGLSTKDGGVLVDASLQTSNPDIYAVGDIAAAENPSTKRESAPNTGPTRKSSRPSRCRACSASPANTPSCLTFSPISTTSAWSTPATPRTISRWCFAVTRTPGSSWRSGSTPTSGCWPGCRSTSGMRSTTSRT